ncbi:MAG: DUF6439 family protein [Phormidesmis sp.]
MPKIESPDLHSSSPASPSVRSSGDLKAFSEQELAEALAQKLAIAPNDWHRLSANRAVRAREQAAAALVYMLKDKPEEALPRLTQAIGWLNKTLKAPPCPTHGEKRAKSKES